MSRVTPPQGLQIDEVWIPGDTIVVIPQWVIHRDERYFLRALEFLPERWLAEKGRLIKDERAFFPFQIGEHCTPFFPLSSRNGPISPHISFLTSLTSRPLRVRWKATGSYYITEHIVPHRSQFRYLICA